MIGTFTTTAFDSRRDFEERRPSGVWVSRNSFTLVGMEWMWKIMAGQLRGSDGGLQDHLGAARLVVGNSSQDFSLNDERLAGDQTAQAALDEGFPTINQAQDETGKEGVEITLRSTFDENSGVFDWQERGVVSAQGVLIDRAVGDQGRKVMGAVWQLEAVLRLDS